jgi:predicted transcriptional regulator
MGTFRRRSAQRDAILALLADGRPRATADVVSAVGTGHAATLVKLGRLFRDGQVTSEPHPQNGRVTVWRIKR